MQIEENMSRKIEKMSFCFLVLQWTEKKGKDGTGSEEIWIYACTVST